MTTTSNDLSISQYDVTTLIEQGVRRCGKLAGALSAEDLLACRMELNLLISALVNEGVPLWTVGKQIYGLVPNQDVLPLTADTVDIDQGNVLYRFNNLPTGGVPASSSGVAGNAFDQNLNTACTQTAPNGNISYNFLTPTVVTTVGILMNSTQTLNPIYEYSQDNISWFTAVSIASSPVPFVKGQWSWQDVNIPQTAQYFRVRETSGGTLDLVEVVFGTGAREITLARTNKDDYQNLPNKNQPGRPLQFWFDRQIIPQLWIWPASSFAFNTVVVWRRRKIQNAGSFTNSLEFPERWLDYILSSLALRMSKVIPGIDLMTRLPILTNDFTIAKNLVWSEERDNSPLYYNLNLTGYTR